MAEVTRSLKHHVSMGNYEWVEYGATVSLTPADLPEGVESDFASMLDFADEVLQNALAPDIQDAWATTADDKSFVGMHPLNTEPTKKGKN